MYVSFFLVYSLLLSMKHRVKSHVLIVIAHTVLYPTKSILSLQWLSLTQNTSTLTTRSRGVLNVTPQTAFTESTVKAYLQLGSNFRPWIRCHDSFHAQSVSAAPLALFPVKAWWRTRPLLEAWQNALDDDVYLDPFLATPARLRGWSAYAFWQTAWHHWPDVLCFSLSSHRPELFHIWEAPSKPVWLRDDCWPTLLP